MGQFELPNSGLTITYSKRLFRIQETLEKPLVPDTVIEYSWESYSKGVDNMLDWVVDDLKKL